MKQFLRERPWIWIVLGIVIMIISMAVVVTIAVKNEPRSVPLEQQRPDGS
jgi:hypothetical protein